MSMYIQCFWLPDEVQRRFHDKVDEKDYYPGGTRIPLGCVHSLIFHSAHSPAMVSLKRPTEPAAQQLGAILTQTTTPQPVPLHMPNFLIHTGKEAQILLHRDKSNGGGRSQSVLAWLSLYHHVISLVYCHGEHRCTHRCQSCHWRVLTAWVTVRKMIMPPLTSKCPKAN